jgi:thioredoxin-like negative regulator of GroEL
MLLQLNDLRIRQKIKSIVRETSAERSKTQSLLSSPTIWALAASLVLLAAAIWFFRPIPSAPIDPMAQQPTPIQPTTQPPVTITPKPSLPNPAPSTNTQKQRLIALAQRYDMPPQQSFIRDASQATNTPSPLESAAQAYERGDYRAALQLLQNIAKNEDLRFLRGHVQFRLGQFRGAARDFSALADSFQFRHEARWQAVLCQIALGDVVAAKAALRTMADDSDFPFKEKAAELFKDLSK